MGFKLFATRGTHRVLREHGIDSVVVSKQAGSPDGFLLDLILHGVLDLLINTPVHYGAAWEEGRWRAAAIARKVPLITTVAGAHAAVAAIRAMRAAGRPRRDGRARAAGLRGGSALTSDRAGAPTSAPATSARPCAASPSRWRADRDRSIRGDEDDPFSRGHICPKAVALKDLHDDPDRLRRPLRRAGASWEEVAWDEALDEAAERLARDPEGPRPRRGGRLPGQPDGPQLRLGCLRPVFLRSAGHPQPLLGDLGRPAAAHAGVAAHVRPPAPAAGPRHRPHATLPRARRQPAGLERQPDDRAGRRAAAQGAARARRPAGRRRSAPHRDRGHRRPSLPSGPGTDALLLLALLHVLFAEGRVRPGPLAALADGLDAVERAGAALHAGAWSPRDGHPGGRRSRALAREFAARGRRWPTGAWASRRRSSAGSPPGSSTCSTS